MAETPAEGEPAERSSRSSCYIGKYFEMTDFSFCSVCRHIKLITLLGTIDEA